jgi:hypothetical protein
MDYMHGVNNQRKHKIMGRFIGTRFELDEDEIAEFTPRRPHYIRCSDRMCGADDCPNCHPENFNDGVLVQED